MADENVSMMMTLTDYQLSEAEAKQLLAINGNDISAAADSYFNAGDISVLKKRLQNSTAKWDETAFGGAAYGADEPTLPTFNIDYAPGLENYPHSTGNSTAPTRPPSPASQRSAVSTHAGDAPMQSQYSDMLANWIQTGYQSNSARPGTSGASIVNRQADSDAGIENAQESGVIGGSNPNFRPATGATYDTSQWALVPTATEVIADPIASQRKREQGQPAILKPSPTFNYLPSLIPILHSIPLFRNKLLCPEVTQNDYWVAEDWWRGSPPESARIIDTTMGYSEAIGLDIIYEAQRLMAFLDSTDRIYGSVDSLLKSDAWKESNPILKDLEDPDDDLLKFLMAWGFAYESHVPDGDLNGVLRSTVNVAESKQESYVLDANVTRGQDRSDFSLYDVLDDALFSSDTSAHIANASNVLILRLTSSRPDAADLGCRIPATLYIDRYLEENKDIIHGMYRDMQQHDRQLRAIQAQVERLSFHIPKKIGAQRVGSLKLLRASMVAYEPRKNDVEQSAEDAKTLSQLQELYQSIENKLASLDEQTRQVQRTIAEISGRFKPIMDDGADSIKDNVMDTMTETTENNAPNTATIEYPKGQGPEDAMKHAYHLYGVATRRDVVYLLHPDIESNATGAKQWWRMQYDSESSNPTIRRDRLSFDEVIERATTESASALLVYANETATSVDPLLSLSRPLQDFVKRDNLVFMQELQESVGLWDKDYGNAAHGGWDDAPPDSEWIPGAGWSPDLNADDFGSRDRNDSNMSSATLTPNTEMDDDAPGADGSRDAVRRVSSASSETVGRSSDAMDIDGARAQAKVSFSDVDMSDAHEEPRMQHVEVLEKKGG